MNTVAVRPHPGGLVFLVQGLVLLASVILARSHLSPLCLQSRLVYKPVVSESIANMCMPVMTSDLCCLQWLWYTTCAFVSDIKISGSYIYGGPKNHRCPVLASSC